MKTYKMRTANPYKEITEKEYIATNKKRAIIFAKSMASQKKETLKSIFEADGKGGWIRL